MRKLERIVMGIDPGLANTGWGIVAQSGAHLECVAYGCISTPAGQPLAERLLKIHHQIGAVIDRFNPLCVGIETVWFGQNVTAAFATGQARGAALVACAEGGVAVGEFSPKQIKLAVVGTGAAEKEQVQYMVRHLLSLDDVPKPDHAADALAAAICFTTHDGYARTRQRMDVLVGRAEARDQAAAARRGGAASLRAAGHVGARDAAVPPGDACASLGQEVS
ncbi:crossover junction endodeoxyribonuclease RuvC [Eggerthellaceae bacterium zg-893]|uniref:Crossover junction endodeoxyribonuclease RuvC n=2 Tax=Xiamenia xianingshaonis TaxID=2682776 RepID=A0A9E6MR05_9ACTN|nr:crossover junction endodeoxyribonuclease RuvC [Xiamenia xianingshaonis]NGM17536.1 crossover junction endodeoxyribonuclease RuvC [Eggerthellaceae bacterium zg-893]NHM13209.1 crossover junction endodeoxyribonuclease RuvC [Xiamenia xianingshaonis]QTU84701.1 crossover junction endodeoxyribonuclease RuvC [Xiamenia xianingshaonis]